MASGYGCKMGPPQKPLESGPDVTTPQMEATNADGHMNNRGVDLRSRFDFGGNQGHVFVGLGNNSMTVLHPSVLASANSGGSQYSGLSANNLSANASPSESFKLRTDTEFGFRDNAGQVQVSQHNNCANFSAPETQLVQVERIDVPVSASQVVTGFPSVPPSFPVQCAGLPSSPVYPRCGVVAADNDMTMTYGGKGVVVKVVQRCGTKKEDKAVQTYGLQDKDGKPYDCSGLFFELKRNKVSNMQIVLVLVLVLCVLVGWSIATLGKCGQM